ncbi:hypothetical protein PhaeoP10_01617 [Phaeobacter inhibens]|nr:hypothetical protein PGA1_c15930 [Phaeobacter inhibens DSM 17395]AUQ45959.1 hypothetical protein PhaeoP10_01617 [Phaeobacter inhibens]
MPLLIKSAATNRSMALAICIAVSPVAALSDQAETNLSCLLEPKCISVQECTTNDAADCKTVQRCPADPIDMKITLAMLSQEAGGGAGMARFTWTQGDSEEFVSLAPFVGLASSMMLAKVPPADTSIDSWMLLMTGNNVSLDERSATRYPSQVTYTGTCQEDK